MKKLLLSIFAFACIFLLSCKTGTNSVNENQQQEELLPLKGVLLTADSYDMYVGDKLQLQLTLQPKNAQYDTIKYTSTNKNVASVDSNGLVTAKKGGAVTIKVSVTSNNGTKTDSYDIGVGNIEKILGKIYTAKNASDSNNFTKQVWTEEFTSIDNTVWTYETGNGSGGWGNGELEYYTEDNAEIVDGSLHITAKKESKEGFDYTSTRMITRDKVSFKYGKIEARMKFSSEKGSWPAFWLLGGVSNDSTSVNWPKCGEIDIMEHANDSDYVNGTLHWNSTGCNPSAQYSHAEYGTNSKTSEIGNIGSLDVTDWHKYGLIWTEKEIQIYVDDIVYYKMAIGNVGNGSDCFNKPFFILLNFAVGGKNFLNMQDKDVINNTIVNNGLDSNQGWDMYVDYIKVWQDANATVETVK